MKVLIIGGNRFMGPLLGWRLLARGDEVTVLNRGNNPDPFGERVERLRADRSTGDLARVLDGRRFDATVDFAAYEPRDVRMLVDCVGDRAGHYVFVGSGQVYLVRDAVPAPARESDYDGELMPRPGDLRELHEWDYGMKKRGCEDALVEAGAHGFRATRLRLPVVNGERDYLRRIESYLWRILDGGPVLLPGGGEEKARHIYALDAAEGIAQLLGDERTHGKAYNLAQEEVPSTFDLVGMLMERLGADDRRVPVAVEELGGLHPTEISAFSQKWMSLLDPSLAKRELGFSHRPLGVYLSSIVASFLSFTPPEPPPDYAHREAERALAKKLGL